MITAAPAAGGRPDWHDQLLHSRPLQLSCMRWSARYYDDGKNHCHDPPTNKDLDGFAHQRLDPSQMTMRPFGIGRLPGPDRRLAPQSAVSSAQYHQRHSTPISSDDVAVVPVPPAPSPARRPLSIDWNSASSASRFQALGDVGEHAAGLRRERAVAVVTVPLVPAARLGVTDHEDAHVAVNLHRVPIAAGARLVG